MRQCGVIVVEIVLEGGERPLMPWLIPVSAAMSRML